MAATILTLPSALHLDERIEEKQREIQQYLQPLEADLAAGKRSWEDSPWRDVLGNLTPEQAQRQAVTECRLALEVAGRELAVLRGQQAGAR